MNSWMSGIYCLIFFGFWRMVYEAANAGVPELSPQVDSEPQAFLYEPQSQLQKDWAEKAVKKYAEAQERKWQRWNEAMFERST